MEDRVTEEQAENYRRRQHRIQELIDKSRTEILTDDERQELKHLLHGNDHES
jgi:hypothetical protein